MDHATHNKIVSFIWSIADDCLRDVFVRGKYRDVILPMFVLRRIDCLLEDTKEAVLAEVKFQKVEVDMAVLDPDGLREASGQVFYNTSKFTLKSLLGNPAQLEANFNYYLDGFSSNVAGKLHQRLVRHHSLAIFRTRFKVAGVSLATTAILRQLKRPQYPVSRQPIGNLPSGVCTEAAPSPTPQPLAGCPTHSA